MSELIAATPLHYGAVAPELWLEDLNGVMIKRHDFRNKSALALLFVPATEAGIAYLGTFSEHAQAFAELNVVVFALIPAPAATVARLAESVPALRLIPDPTHKAWEAYQVPAFGAGAFVLDLYGGVQGQAVVADVAAIPAAQKVLGWAQAAQFRCNI